MDDRTERRILGAFVGVGMSAFGLYILVATIMTGCGWFEIIGCMACWAFMALVALTGFVLDDPHKY